MVSFVTRSFLGALTLLAMTGACLPHGAQAQPAIEPTSLGTLKPQTLDVGQCGLFLWSRSEDQAFVAVAYNQPSFVRVRVDGDDRQLERTAFGGEPLSGLFERQTYEGGRVKLRIEIDLNSVRPMRDGAIVSRGAVHVTIQGEQESVVPVGGMIACKRA